MVEINSLHIGGMNTHQLRRVIDNIDTDELRRARDSITQTAATAGSHLLPDDYKKLRILREEIKRRVGSDPKSPAFG